MEFASISMTRTIIILLLQAVLSLSANTGNTTSVSGETKVGWYSGPTERGTLSLIWSCVATIIACTWTILHLNVPEQGESPKTKVLRKAKWMVITILFPEFIFSKAVCELRLALKTLRDFKESMLLQHPYGTEKTASEVVSETSKLGWVTQKEDATIRFLYRLMGLGVPKPGHDGSSKVDGEQDVELGSAIRDSVAVSARPASHSIVRADQQTGNHSSGTDSVKVSTEAPRAVGSAQPAGLIDENANAMSTQTRDTRNAPEDEDLADDAREIQPQTWTLVHSYLANMGGIVYKHSDTIRLVLTGYHFGRHYRWEATHPLESLVLSKNEIEDKSKADWLLKTLSVLQISSLVLTVAVRGATSLPLTQLEIATVAFSVIAIITSAANWWKPKDISEPIVVPRGTSGHSQFSGRSDDDPCSSYHDYTQSFMFVLRAPVRAKLRVGHTILRTRVPNDVIDMYGDIPLVYILMAVSSVLFGGLHCLAWDFDFPSDVELQLWRVASIASALLPISSLGLSMFFNYMALTYPQKKMSTSVIRRTKDYMMCSEIYGKLCREAEQSSTDVPAARKQSSRTSASAEGNDQLHSNQQETIQGDRTQKHHRIRRAVLSDLDLAMMALRNIRDGSYTLEARNNLHTLEARIKHLRARRESDRWVWEELKGSEKSYFETTPHEVNPDTQTNFTENFTNSLLEWNDKYASHLDGNIYYHGASITVTFIGGVIYVLSRLIIVAIMFSSLRATPKGVYENTPWTRFLPSFS